MDRRQFFGRVGAFGLSGALGTLLAACGAEAAKPPRTTTSSTTVPNKRAGVSEVDGLPVADWVKEENARGDRTRAWIIPRYSETSTADIEGYVNQVSYQAGDELKLMVSTHLGSYRAFVYRMGYYAGFGARQVAASPVLVGHVQPVPPPTPGTNMIECDWATSYAWHVTDEWPTGMYLIKLNGAGGRDQYVPFTVRDDSSRSAYLVQSSVTTWQAYNPFGGYSLYGGPASPGQSSLDNRARVVSFDRPYSHDATALDARGSGDFLGNGFPFVYLAERHGLDVSYATDVDLHTNAAQLAQHRCFVSLGHDEYWSMEIRDGVEKAVAGGVNVAFFGANACYRQIRFEDAASGKNRRMVCYKDAEADPIYATDRALATGGSWATDPVPRPESSLIGLMYQSFGAPFGPLTVTDGSSWVYEGTGLKTGDTIPDLIGSEFDGFEPAYPHPDNVELLGHSPTRSVSGQRHSDLSYYTAKGGGAVFACGTANWVPSVWSAPPQIEERLGVGTKWLNYEHVTTITMNVLRAFGSGPSPHASKSTWQKYYAPSAHALPSKDV